MDKDHSSSAEREPAWSGAVNSDDITFVFFEFNIFYLMQDS